MSKLLKFSSDARASMLEGITCLYNATRVTLGPKGRNVIIEQDFGTPLIINDGVTIAKNVELEDHFANLGASVIIEAASKTNDIVGDGTTTAIILASKLILEGMKKVEQGINPVILRKGMEYFLPLILKKIDESSIPVNSLEDLERVAMISSGSKEIAKNLRLAYENVGYDGVITIEESKTSETYLDLVKGYNFDKGYLSPYMINNQEKQIAELDKPFILVINKKINSMNEIVPYLEKSITENSPLLIICDEIEQEVLNTLVLNKLRGVFNCVVVKAPYYGDKKNKTLEDLAIVTKATLIDDSFVKDDKITVLGKAQKVVIKKDSTTIIEGFGNHDEIEKRCEMLKKQRIIETSSYEKEQLEARIAKLLGGVAIIKIGGSTETELKELKFRSEDALNATKAAMVSGIIEGGGKVFYQISESLENQEYQDVLEIMKTTLKAPFYQILENAGERIEDVIKKVDQNTWYDASNGTYGSMITKGIIDPSSVAKSALINAVSIAGIFLTTECAIVQKTETKKDDNELM